MREAKGLGDEPYLDDFNIPANMVPSSAAPDLEL